MSHDAEPYYQAWQTLSISRPVGMGGPLPIPLSEVETYCRMAAVPLYERLAFARVMRRVDGAFLDLIDSQKSSKVVGPKERSRG